jgi:hypothetical protein
VAWKLFDIEHVKAVPQRQPIDRDGRKIRGVFVIDRVELIFIDQALKMRELERDDALGRKDTVGSQYDLKLESRILVHVSPTCAVGGLFLRFCGR